MENRRVSFVDSSMHGGTPPSMHSLLLHRENAEKAAAAGPLRSETMDDVGGVCGIGGGVSIRQRGDRSPWSATPRARKKKRGPCRVVGAGPSDTPAVAGRSPLAALGQQNGCLHSRLAAVADDVGNVAEGEEKKNKHSTLSRLARAVGGSCDCSSRAFEEEEMRSSRSRPSSAPAELRGGEAEAATTTTTMAVDDNEEERRHQDQQQQFLSWPTPAPPPPRPQPPTEARARAPAKAARPTLLPQRTATAATATNRRSDNGNGGDNVSSSYFSRLPRLPPEQQERLRPFDERLRAALEERTPASLAAAWRVAASSSCGGGGGGESANASVAAASTAAVATAPLPIDIERLNLLLSVSCRIRRRGGAGGRDDENEANDDDSDVVVDPADAESLVASAVRRGERPTPATYHALAGLWLAHEQRGGRGRRDDDDSLSE